MGLEWSSAGVLLHWGFCCFVFLLYITGWSWIHGNPAASVSPVLELQTWAAAPSFLVVFLNFPHNSLHFSKNIPMSLRKSKQRTLRSDCTRRENMKFIGGKIILSWFSYLIGRKIIFIFQFSETASCFPRLKEFAALYDTVRNERNKFVNLLHKAHQKVNEIRERHKMSLNELEILRNSAVSQER